MLVQDVRRQGDALVIQKHGSSLHFPAPLQCYPDQVVQAVTVFLGVVNCLTLVVCVKVTMQLAWAVTIFPTAA